LLVSEAVIAENACWLLYRQHSDSSCTQADVSGSHTASRRYYLDWLEQYLDRIDARDVSALAALRAARWRLDHPRLARVARAFSRLMRTIRN
ncbi:MAG: hypothetical protein R3178_01685, partial [Rhodothermales bacterium]|nr:hypothetical protein [Rhodothermales bacterium]